MLDVKAARTRYTRLKRGEERSKQEAEMTTEEKVQSRIDCELAPVSRGEMR